VVQSFFPTGFLASCSIYTDVSYTHIEPVRSEHFVHSSNIHSSDNSIYSQHTSVESFVSFVSVNSYFLMQCFAEEMFVVFRELLRTVLINWLRYSIALMDTLKLYGTEHSMERSPEPVATEPHQHIISK
jgi:hypothetical protein